MSKRKQNNARPFRFPFDLDRRIFLLLAAVFFILSIKKVNELLIPRVSPTTLSKKISSAFNKQLKSFNKEVKLLNANSIRFDKTDQNELKNISNKNWSYFVFKRDSLIFWNKTDNIPISFKNIKPDSLYSYKNDNEVGVILKKTRKLGNETLAIIGKFPLYVYYKVNNNVFKSHFTFLGNEPSNFEDFGYKLTPISAGNTPSYEIEIEGQARFDISEKSSILEVTDKNFWHFFLSAIPFILFGVSIHTFFKVSVKENPLKYFSLLLLTVGLIRGLGYYFDFPDNYSEFHLFSPILYGSTGLNISLGDVFINTCLLFWILFFFIMNVQNKVFEVKRKWSQIGFIAACTLITLSFMWLSLNNIKSIIFDSQLNFDTTDYNHINEETIIGLGTLLLTFMNYVLIVIIYNRYFERYFSNKYVKYLIPLTGIVIMFSIASGSQLEIMCIGIVWTSLLLVILSTKFLNTKFDFNSYKLIYWLIFFSASCVLLIHYFDTQNELNLRESFAENLIRFENQNTESDLSNFGKQLQNDEELNKIQNEAELKKYINRKYLFPFVAEYNTKLEVSAALGDSSKLKEFRSLLNNTNSRTVHQSNPKILLVNESGSEKYILFQETNQYLIKLSLSTSHNLSEHYDAKFVQELDLSGQSEIPTYQFAYYKNKQLVNQTGIEVFPPILAKDILKKSGQVTLSKNRNFSDIIVHSDQNDQMKSLVIRKRKNAFYKISTTYAYIFTSAFILISLYILGNVIARSNLRRKRFINLLGLTLRMRIHLSILFVELISLVVIGFFTILILSNNAKQDALHKANIASNEIKQVIQKLNFKDYKSSTIINSFNHPTVKNSIAPYLDKHDVGLNLYDLKGTKIHSTVADRISGSLPNLINPKAFSELKLKSNISSLQSERIGSLDYYTIYSNITNKFNDKIAILEIANYSSQQIIRQNNSNIITMLINIYAFVFLISSLFAFYITKRLTNSFSKIVTQFSKINLTQVNKPLHWPYSDEIGLLIKEYNRTLFKLENSTAMLAKSERETAWREMAKQIAHEIKNPLTPMSLSLQSLQAAIKRNDPNVPQLTQKMTTTVLEQIKVLTRTASNFSEFATMTDIVARKESLVEVLESTTGIYSDSDDAEFLFVLPQKDIPIFVDKVKLIRVLTNVIQNAIQAVPEDKTGQIMLTVTKKDENLVDITISDDGVGIPVQFRKKIFEPNFTTKSSGSGLGLAMCKDIMLKSNGDIYFETEENKGSSFHIILPIFHEK